MLADGNKTAVESCFEIARRDTLTAKLTFNASTDNVGVAGYNVYLSTNGA